MNIITLFNIGFHINYWKTDIHPFFTKNMKNKPKIKHFSIRFWKYSYLKDFWPTYKITVTWDDFRISTYNLEYLLDIIKGVTYEKDYHNKTIEVFIKSEDHIRNLLEDVITDMRLYVDSMNECEEGEEEPEPRHFKTKVELFKW